MQQHMYVWLLRPVLLSRVLKKFWCQLPKDGEEIAPKHVGAI